MERNDSTILEVGAARSCGREIGGGRTALPLKRRAPLMSIEVFRDLGVSDDAIAAYFRRFPNSYRC